MVAAYVPSEKAEDISPNKDGGILKEIRTEGEGTDTPLDGDEVFVHYVGTLTDGTEFDSSRKRNESFTFTLGRGMVIKGWEVSVATMKKGEKAMFTIQHQYAYGEAGSPPKIPPKATLNFEIELLEWKGEDLSKSKDGSIIRRYIEKGSGVATATEGANVEVHITGTHAGKVFEDRDVSFCLGEGSEVGVVPGLERALEKFKKGDKATLKLKSHVAFGAQGDDKLGVPPNADVDYEVTMINFQRAKKNFELDAAERLLESASFKEKGTNYFKQEKYGLAVKQYKKIVTFLEYEDSMMTEEETVKKDHLLLIGHLNLAACFLKLQDYVNAKEHSNKALEFDPSNEKALFRQGQALQGLGEPAQAKESFAAVVTINPKNKAAITQMNACKQAIREQKEHDKKLYANMFDKFAKIDREKEAARLAKQPDCLSNPGEWDNANGDKNLSVTDITPSEVYEEAAKKSEEAALP